MLSTYTVFVFSNWTSILYDPPSQKLVPPFWVKKDDFCTAF
jgi:hypothetical protein